MNEKRFISEPVILEERASNDGTKQDYITGYGIVFNQWSLPLTMEMQNGQRVQFVEKIDPKAIEGLNMDNAVSMVDHKFTLGKRNKGTMDISIDERGVKYSVVVPKTTIGQDAMENIKNGNLEGSSFQFSIPANGDYWDKTFTPYQRTITKFSSVTEMGPVTYPAYPDTTAAMRSLEETEKQVEDKEETEKIELEKRIAKLKRKYNYEKTKN
jgi:HK97 family phage prohead protease